MTATPILRLRGIDKSFGAVQVLHDVSFDVHPGEVTALVGDNGAGKSTLVKCIGGIHPFDGGEYWFEGEQVQVHSPREAAAMGVEIVYQDLALCDNLDIVQNMFLGREKRRGLVLDDATMEEIAALYLGRMAAQVSTSDVTHSQVVELITSGRSGDLGLAHSNGVTA
jgi:D-xylose transport system ATP-binding protein